MVFVSVVLLSGRLTVQVSCCAVAWLLNLLTCCLCVTDVLTKTFALVCRVTKAASAMNQQLCSYASVLLGAGHACASRNDKGEAAGCLFQD